MKSVAIVGGPPLYVEAIIARLESEGVKIVDFNETIDARNVDTILVYCETEADWDRLLTLEEYRVVVVLPDFNSSNLMRALAVGASPTHLRTSSEIIVETAKAAANSEALLPIGFAQCLARKAQATEQPDDMSAIERQLIVALAGDRSVSEIAHDFHYSDRTIRRKLQSLYVKIGVSTRAEAVLKCKLIECPEKFAPKT